MIHACMKTFFAMVLHGYLLTGKCDGCDNGYYMEKEGCKLCSINCSSCLSGSSCTSCKVHFVGHHGLSCSSLCPDSCHDKECNKTNGLCLSCKTGYFSDEGGSCVECPPNCTTCKSSKFCFACKRGYKGKYCQDICSSCEKDSTCDKNTGYCIESCRTGFSGELCDIRCDSKCSSCDRLNQFECNSCAHDRYGLDCDEMCSLNCFNKTCDDSDGACVEGCKTGHWGQMCNNSCPKFCKDNVCNVTDGECLKGQVDTNLASKSTWIVLSCVILIVAIVIVISMVYIKRRHVAVSNCCHDFITSRAIVRNLFELCMMQAAAPSSSPNSRYTPVQSGVGADIHNDDLKPPSLPGLANMHTVSSATSDVKVGLEIECDNDSNASFKSTSETPFEQT